MTRARAAAAKNTKNAAVKIYNLNAKSWYITNATTEKKMKNAPLVRRIIAFIIDYVLLGIFGLILGAFFFDFFFKLNFYGLILGLAVYILYFGVLNSNIGKGQSIGKKILKIKVTDSSGSFLSFKKSCLRAFILYLPITTPSLMVPLMFSNFNLGFSVLFTLIIGFYLATIYLLLLNKPSRQCLHDLAVNSFVLRRGEQPVSGFNRKISVAVIFALCLVLSVLIPRVPLLVSARETGKLVQEKFGVPVQALTFNYRKNFNTGKTTGSVSITVRKYDGEDKQLAQDIAQTLYDNNPTVRQMDYITVVLNRDYNIGIAKANTYNYYQYPVLKSSN